MDHRDGRAPVALAADEPVAHVVVGPWLGEPVLFAHIDHCGIGSITRKTVKSTRVDKRSTIGIFVLPRRHIIDGLRPGDDLSYLKSVLLREGEVPAVMSRHCHDCACAITHENVVCDPDGDLLTRIWVDCKRPREDTSLLLFCGEAVNFGLASAGRDVRVYISSLGVRRDLANKRVLGGKHQEGGPHDCVQTCRKDGHGVS